MGIVARYLSATEKPEFSEAAATAMGLIVTFFLSNRLLGKTIVIIKNVVPLPAKKVFYYSNQLTKMKRSIRAILLLVVMLVSFNAKADHDQVITYDQLPEVAQAFLKQYFANKVPLVVTVDWDDYAIRYSSGEKVEFDKQGNWKEIDCRSSLVPAELIPEEIKTNINATFPGAIILKLDRNRRGYEVKLNDCLEVEYSPTFQVIDIDD